MKHYGTPDADKSAFEYLMTVVSEEDVLYVVHHQRVPAGVKPCLLPLSLTVSAVLKNKNVVSVRQMAPGQPTKKV